MKNTISYFTAFFNNLTDKSGSDTKDYTYTNSFKYTQKSLDGTEIEVSENLNYYHVQDDAQSEALGETGNNTIGVLEKFRTFGRNDFTVFIKNNKIIEVFKKMYNAL